MSLRKSQMNPINRKLNQKNKKKKAPSITPERRKKKKLRKEKRILNKN
jgi:hypothetical protein